MKTCLGLVSLWPGAGRLPPAEGKLEVGTPKLLEDEDEDGDEDEELVVEE